MLYYFCDNCPSYIYYETMDSAINVADITTSNKARIIQRIKCERAKCHFAQPIQNAHAEREPTPEDQSSLEQIDEESLVEAYYQELTAERLLETSASAEIIDKRMTPAPVRMMPYDTVLFTSNDAEDGRTP